MSARFGRNKRRRAREALAEAQATVETLRFEKRVALEVSNGREELLRKVQAELADVREAVIEGFGDHSILLSASSPSDTYWDVLPDFLQMPRMEMHGLGALSEQELMSAVRSTTTVDLCHVLSAEVDEDHWTRVQHFFIADRNERVLGYTLPERSAREVPKKVFIRRTAEAMAELMLLQARREAR